MRLWIRHPKSNKPDMMVTLVVVAVLAAVFKFLTDGISVTVGSHIINFGHVDSMAYGSLLAPVLGAHGYLDSRPKEVEERVDNPDEN